MITNNEFVSRVSNNLKALTKDGHISDRFVLSIGKTKAKFYMSQKLDEMTLFREDGIVTTISCFELESVDYKSCGIFEFSVCKNIMKSIHKLPDGIFGKNGSGIFTVMNIENSEEYKYITPQRFAELRKRKYTRDTTRYYTIADGHIILPNSTNQLLELRMITPDKKAAEDVSSCTDSSCKSIWEYEFVCPDRFLDRVVGDTLTELGSLYRTSVEDSNPNLDVNQKSKTVQ
jgi:hypothetical protein